LARALDFSTVPLRSDLKVMIGAQVTGFHGEEVQAQVIISLTLRDKEGIFLVIPPV